MTAGAGKRRGGRPRGSKNRTPEGVGIMPWERGCLWRREDGRILYMPWTVDELWARLCRDVVMVEPQGSA